MKYDNQEGFQETDIDRRYKSSQEAEANYGRYETVTIKDGDE